MVEPVFRTKSARLQHHYCLLHIFSLGPMQLSIALCCGQMLCSKEKNNTSEYCLLLGRGLSSPDKLQCLRVCYIGHFWYLKYAYLNPGYSFLEFWIDLLGVIALLWSLVVLLLVMTLCALSCTVLFQSISYFLCFIVKTRWREMCCL